MTSPAVIDNDDVIYLQNLAMSEQLQLMIINNKPSTHCYVATVLEVVLSQSIIHETRHTQGNIRMAVPSGCVIQHREIVHSIFFTLI